MLMKAHWTLACVLLGGLFYACNGEITNFEPDQSPKLMVYLTDDPTDLDAVNIDVVDVLINPQEEAGGWRSLNSVHTGVYDILTLTGGIDTLLGEAEVPEGRLQQIRLLLGENNTIEINGQLQKLTTPSAQQSGLKVKIKQDLEPGITYKLILDFDAARSIVEAGNSGKFLLKPVLRANLEALSGSIRGQVNPDTVQVLATAFNATDTISAFSDDEGVFVLRGAPPGTYQLLVIPEETSGFTEKTIDDVVVELGQSTDVGVIDLTN